MVVVVGSDGVRKGRRARGEFEKSRKNQRELWQGRRNGQRISVIRYRSVGGLAAV